MTERIEKQSEQIATHAQYTPNIRPIWKKS